MTQELVEAAGSWRTRAGLALALLLAALVGLFALGDRLSPTHRASALDVQGPYSLEKQVNCGLGWSDSATVPPGDLPGVCAFQIVFTTSEAIPAGGLTITDTLPAGLSGVGVIGLSPAPPMSCTDTPTDLTCTNSGGPLPAGSTVTITWEVDVTANAAFDPRTLVNEASAQVVAYPGQLSDGASIQQGPGYGIGKTVSPTTVPITGGPVTYTITFTANLPLAAGDALVTDTAPAGVTFSSVTAGSGWLCTNTATTLSCTNTSAITPPATVTVATVSATVAQNPSVNPRALVNQVTAKVGAAQGTASATINQNGLGTLTKSAGQSTLPIGGGGTNFTVTFTNQSGVSIPAGALTLTDAVPAGMSIGTLSVSPSGSLNCSVSGQTVTCTNASAIASGTSVTVTIPVTVGTNEGRPPRSFTNTANVTVTIGGVPYTLTANATVTQRGEPSTVAKQPLLAWAGQVVALQAEWPEECSGVRYTKQNGPGSFYPSYEEFVEDGDPGVILDGEFSSALYESEDPGEVDVLALCEGDEQDYTQPFVVYYMKLESVTLGLVSGSRLGHNSGPFNPANPWNTATDTTSRSSNVSADVLVRARVKGWTTSANPSGRPAGTDANGGTLPAGRWVLPDDWRQLAGGELAESLRPNWDIMVDPARGLSCSAETTCNSRAPLPSSSPAAVTHSNVIGPFSLLDGPLPTDGGDIEGHNSWLPDQQINMWDAPMPPAEVRFVLTGSGFLKPVVKFGGNVDANNDNVPDHPDGVYTTNPFYRSYIPAEPEIPATNMLIGTRTNYRFWDPVQRGLPVYSAAGADPAKTTAAAGKKSTSGYTSLTVYSDNHGEAMVWVNGDAGLTMEQCAPPTSNGVPANLVLIESGWYCEFGDKVGSSTLRAVADYPQFRKHYPLGSNPVTIDWTWGGIKRVRVADGETPQFKYVIFEVTDRDGFCDDSPSLWPVLGEEVEFIIDSGDGRIVGVSGGGTIGTLGRDATTTTIPTDGDDNGQLDPGARPTPDLGVCQAWIRVSNSLLTQTNVMVRAFDPEGTVLFDEVIDFTSTHTYTLSFRWTLVTWVGADNIPPADALRGQGANAGGTNIFDRVTAVYGWNAQSQSWLAFFPSGVSVPGANNLTALRTGEAYWIAITAPGPVSWTVIKDVD